LAAAAKFLVEATKNSFVVPNFVAETKSFFFRVPAEKSAESGLVTAERSHSDVKT